jgi:hypothetical protein
MGTTTHKPKCAHNSNTCRMPSANKIRHTPSSVASLCSETFDLRKTGAPQAQNTVVVDGSAQAITLSDTYAAGAHDDHVLAQQQKNVQENRHQEGGIHCTGQQSDKGKVLQTWLRQEARQQAPAGKQSYIRAPRRRLACIYIDAATCAQKGTRVRTQHGHNRPPVPVVCSKAGERLDFRPAHKSRIPNT